MYRLPHPDFSRSNSFSNNISDILRPSLYCNGSFIVTDICLYMNENWKRYLDFIGIVTLLFLSTYKKQK